MKCSAAASGGVWPRGKKITKNKKSRQYKDFIEILYDKWAAAGQLTGSATGRWVQVEKTPPWSSSSVTSEGDGKGPNPPIFTSTMFTKDYLFNLQLCSDAVSIKFSHFSHSNSLSLSNRGKVNSTGMSWFLCGQTEMSELALEQNGWRRSNRSGKANELSDCCHTRWQTAAGVWRLPASPTQPPAPMGPSCYPTWSLFELVFWRRWHIIQLLINSLQITDTFCSCPRCKCSLYWNPHILPGKRSWNSYGCSPDSIKKQHKYK